MKNQSRMLQPMVAEIRIEYSDGSVDTFENLSAGNLMQLFGWRRESLDHVGELRAYCVDEVALVLFQAAMTQVRAVRTLPDIKLFDVVRLWKELSARSECRGLEDVE